MFVCRYVSQMIYCLYENMFGKENKNATSETLWNQALFGSNHRAPEECVKVMLIKFTIEKFDHKFDELMEKG